MNSTALVQPKAQQETYTHLYATDTHQVYLITSKSGGFIFAIDDNGLKRPFSTCTSVLPSNYILLQSDMAEVFRHQGNSGNVIKYLYEQLRSGN